MGGGEGGTEFRYQINEQIPTLSPFLPDLKFKESIPSLRDSKQSDDRLQPESRSHSYPESRSEALHGCCKVCVLKMRTFESLCAC